MFSSGPLLLLALLVLVLLVWYESLRFREAVTKMCGQICEQSGLQLLDQTVSLTSLSVRRSPLNRFQIYRIYQFDVSTSGADRRPGYVAMAGKYVEAIQIEDEEGMMTIYPPGPPQIQ